MPIRLSLEGVEHGPMALREAFGRVGVTSAESAYSLAQQVSASQVDDVLEFLYYACEITIYPAELKKRRNLLLSPFGTGFTFGPCVMSGRMKALETSIKRALLLNSHLLVANPFAYSRSEPFSVDTDISRLNLATLLAHVFDVLPLLEEGVIGFYPNALSVCDEHKELIEAEEDRIHKRLLDARDLIVQSLLRGVSATLLLDDAKRFYIRFRGQHPIINPSGDMDLVFGKGAVPEEIQGKVGQELSVGELLAFSDVIPILDRIEHLAFLFSLSAHFCSLDLVATDETEIKALNAANLLEEQDRHAFTNLETVFPDFGMLSMKRLLRLMKRDEESLQRFRDAFPALIREVNEDAFALSPAERAQLIGARLKKERERLSGKLAAHRNRSMRRAVGEMLAGGLGLGLGLFSGMVGSAAAAFNAIGGISMVKGLAAIARDAIRIPEDIQADSWYFLWNAKRLRKRR